jgi:hypothetical protein
VAALEHENVLPIYDVGDAEGEPYLVMPFLENGTLAERLERGEVTPAQAIEWIRQLGTALDAAHAAGVLHRDVKPANVMIGGGGRLLVADFGIAKSNQSGDLTATGIALGTPAYMAPELARGEGATSASDRYALGVIAYELLCGRPPFIGDNALALLHQHLTTPARVRRRCRRGGADHRRSWRPPPDRSRGCNTRGAGFTGRAAAVLAALVVIAGGWLLFQSRQRTNRAEPAELAANDLPGPAAPLEEPLEPSIAEPEGSRADAAKTTDSARESLPPPPVATQAASQPPAPPPAPAATAASNEEQPAAGHWAMPPAEAFAIFGLVADAWRHGRFDSELFAQVEQRSASMRSTDPSPGVELLGKWIAGGRALIAGDHAEAARKAIALEPQVRQGRPRQVVARFAGDQLLWSGDIAAAISWYKRLLIAPDRTEIGAVLRTLSQEGGPQLVARACADGFTPACEPGRSPGGPRSRRARSQP